MLRIDVHKQRGDFTLEAAIEVPTPGTIALFGRSGCGKTTLVNTIAGLLPADRAYVAIDDAREAAKPCPALYQACHLANTKACSDTAPLTN